MADELFIAKQMYEISLADAYSQSLNSFENFFSHCVHATNEKYFSNFYAIFEDKKLISFLNMNIIMNEAEMDYLFVSNDYRRQGLSNLLLSIFEYSNKYIGNHQVSKIILEVGENNTPALSFYLKTGFIKISVRKKYYKNMENAFVMEKNL
ncbi:GNAT family N-acetyltransferase [Fluviispira vulneris]|uniref:GNAT family N-acetyltransferase n=1 Tax=Fluviispira vulneris TaxID=2763012 RepID=UPI00164706CD|nr:GNAT family N-acetyltransferase [Fluviispira vulneris]